MTECEFCDEEFDSERELHLHWGEEHEDELNSHQKEKVKKAERKKENEAEAKKSKRRSLMLKGLTGITLLIFVALILPQVLSMFKSSPFQLEQQPMIGNESAPVTVVEFGDYRCPYCQRFDQEVFPQLKENYIETGDVKFYFINFPFLGPGSQLGAKAGECVVQNEPESFWDFHHTLYENQGSESIRWLTDDLVMEITAQTTNISEQEMNACIDSSQANNAVQTDKRIGQGNGVGGTPAVYVNGQRVGNDYQSIKNAIDKHLENGN